MGAQVLPGVYRDGMTISDFVLARAADDERAADVAEEYAVKQWGGSPTASAITISDRDGSPLWSSNRLRLDAAAKRQLVHEWQTFNTVAKSNPMDERGLHVQLSAVGITQGLDRALRHVAAIYADHPDYQPEWRV